RSRPGPQGPVLPAVSGARDDRRQPVRGGRVVLVLRLRATRLRPGHRTARRNAAGALSAVLLHVRSLQREHLPALRAGLLLRAAPAAMVAGRAVGLAGRGDAPAVSRARRPLPDGVGGGASGGHARTWPASAPDPACSGGA